MLLNFFVVTMTYEIPYKMLTSFLVNLKLEMNETFEMKPVKQNRFTLLLMTKLSSSGSAHVPVSTYVLVSNV